MREDIPQKMIDDACEVYLQHRGLDHKQITHEVKAKGWPFHRNMLYRRNTCSGPRTAWPEKYGWDAMLTPEDRARLVKARAKRRAARPNREKFQGWLKAEFPEWKWAWKFQRHIYKSLGRVTSGETKRLMIFMPPRHGKSEMVTVRYTAWRLMREAGLNVILGSYNQRLADKFSRKIKRIVLSGGVGERTSGGEKKNAVSRSTPQLPDSSTPLLRTASEWETPGGGVVRSVGVGGGIAGFGAGLIVIDDPVRNRADAESEAFRERVWDWFNDDIYTRLEPDAAIILIQTRWHEDDLAGRLLKEMDDGGEEWEVVCLPALAEEVGEKGSGGVGESLDGGESPLLPNSSTPLLGDPLGRKPGTALCPERFDVKALARIKKKLGSYSFSALYQQQPAPAEGGQFKREWFRKIVDEAPPNLRWKRGYDLAVSTRTSADYTASFRCAKDKLGNLYIADGYRARIEYPEQRRYAIERMQAEKNTEHGIESALHGAAFVQDIRRDMRYGHIALRKVRVDTDKLTRALAWLNLAEEGKVFLVRGPWIDEFVEEIARFPTGRHDDQVDAVSVAVNMLAHPAGTTHGF